jgi:protein-S-isoprenylcysteine O-methyltransferase Ste14
MELRANYDRFFWPLKALTAVAIGIFAWRIVDEYRVTGYWLLLAVLAGELLTIGLVLIGPRPKDVSVSAKSLFFTNAASFYFLFISVKPGLQIVPPAIPGVLVLFGIFMQIAAKLTLGRCFGLLPAVRGIVVIGPYRLVRHPIYFGYLCTHIGFLCFAFSWHNVLVYTGLYACQVMRILDEESLLSKSPEYAAYMKKVRWRLLPGVF